jgi:hypothetical protein
MLTLHNYCPCDKRIDLPLKRDEIGGSILPGPFLLMGNYVLNSFPLGLRQTQQQCTW